MTLSTKQGLARLGECPLAVVPTRICDSVLEAVLASMNSAEPENQIPLSVWLDVLSEPGMRNRIMRLESLAARIALSPVDTDCSMLTSHEGVIHRTFRLRRSHEALISHSADGGCSARIGSVRLGAPVPYLVLPSIGTDIDRLVPESIRQLPVGAVLTQYDAGSYGQIEEDFISASEEGR